MSMEQELRSAHAEQHRKKEAASWLDAAMLLNQRLHHVEHDVCCAVEKGQSNVAVEVHEMECKRLQYQSQLVANIVTVRKHPHRWLQQFQQDVHDSIGALDAQLAQLGDVVGDANRVMIGCTTRPVSDPHSAEHHPHHVDPMGGSVPPSSSSTADRAPKSVAELQQQDSRPPAVIDHDNFLLKYGGNTLGWSDDDHQVFLNAVVRFPGNTDDLVVDVAQRLNMAPAQVAHHVELYRTLLALQKEKKLSIQAFKEQRAADAENKKQMEAIQKFKNDQALRRVNMDKERKAIKRQEQISSRVSAYKERKVAEQTSATQSATMMYQQKAQAREKIWQERKQTIEPALTAFKQQRAVAAKVEALKKREANELPKPLKPTSSTILQRRHEEDIARVKARAERARNKDYKANVAAKEERLTSYLDSCRDKGLVRSPSVKPTSSLTANTASSSARTQKRAASAGPAGCESRGPMHLQPKPTAHFSRGVVPWCGSSHLRN